MALFLHDVGPFLKAMNAVRKGVRSLKSFGCATGFSTARFKDFSAAIARLKLRISQRPRTNSRRGILAARAAVARHHASILSNEDRGYEANAEARRNRNLRRQWARQRPVKPSFA